VSEQAPTLDDLRAAKSELARLEAAFDNYSGNNPNKYRASIRNARARVRTIVEALKRVGVIEKTEQERLEETLDRLAPNAKHRDTVSLEGRAYERTFFPAERNRKGNVTEWHGAWRQLAANAPTKK
jgi:hypothetical protein